MSEGRPDASESARLFRQRLEMGAEEIFLEGMSREEALEALRQARLARGTTRDAGVAGGSVSTDAGREDTAGSGGPRRDHRPGPGPHDARSAASGSDASSGADDGDDGGGGAGRSGRGGSDGGPPDASEGHPPLPDDYDTLKELALGCTRCRLSENRTQVVFSDGPRHARLMVVGEAPGANEDRTGLPFVGAAGKYLDLLLATVGLSREESVYIANVLKCRPPGNRDPKPDEIECCSPYLRKQIDLVRPEVLLAVGSFSGKLLTGRDKVALGELRGEVHSYHGVPLVVTYHPAALLRNARWTRSFWEDLQLLREVMDRQPTGAS